MFDTIKQCNQCKTSIKIFTYCNEKDDREFLDFWNGFIDFKSLKAFCKNESYNKDFENNICPFCKCKLIDTMLTWDDFKAIGENSNYNRDLLLAMIELRNRDVIEFETKMQPFREMSKKVQEEKERKRKEYFDYIDKVSCPHCPTCGSSNLAKVSTFSKIMDSAVWGFGGKQRYKTYHCNNCGYEW